MKEIRRQEEGEEESVWWLLEQMNALVKVRKPGDPTWAKVKDLDDLGESWVKAIHEEYRDFLARKHSG